MKQNTDTQTSEIETVTIPAAEYEELLKIKKAAKGVAGWLITTKNKGYTGETGGVYFRGGRGFLPDSMPDAERKAKELMNDFGYQVEHVENLVIGAEFIDALTQPATRRV